MAIKGRLYIRHLEIVDDADNIIYRVKNVPIEKGLQKALEIVESKDGRKTVKDILHKLSKYLDNEFKALFKLEDEDETK